MLKIAGYEKSDTGVTDLSFRTSSTWTAPPEFAALGDDNPMDIAVIQFGKDRTGPIFYVFAAKPGVDFPISEAHSHDSDNWRISLKGEFPMGKQVYRAGDFRLNEGRKSYPSDNLALGPDGGWSVVFFADRRGTEMRPVNKTVGADMQASIDANRMLAGWCDLQESPDEVADKSCIVSTHGKLPNAGYQNGHFSDVSGWRSDDTGQAGIASVLDGRNDGPLVLHLDTPAGGLSVPSGGVPTEVIRVIYKGSCVVDGIEYVEGDMRVEEAGLAAKSVEAGPEGCQEVLFFGGAQAVFEAASNADGWPAFVAGLVADLQGLLADRLTPATV